MYFLFRCLNIMFQRLHWEVSVKRRDRNGLIQVVRGVLRRSRKSASLRFSSLTLSYLIVGMSCRAVRAIVPIIRRWPPTFVTGRFDFRYWSKTEFPRLVT